MSLFKKNGVEKEPFLANFFFLNLKPEGVGCGEVDGNAIETGYGIKSSLHLITLSQCFQNVLV